jgi:hypothetical protein
MGATMLLACSTGALTASIVLGFWFVQKNMRVARFDPACLQGARVSSSESQLGVPCTHYELNPPNSRYALPVLGVRGLLAQCATDACQSNALGEGFVLRPVLTATLKTLFVGGDESPLRARLAFDIDCEDDGRPCEPAWLHATLVEWLQRVVPVPQWHKEPCVILGGFFADKPASYHVYFCERCLYPTPNNRFGEQGALLAPLNTLLATYGLKVDGTIHTSGLKYPYCDKWLQSTKRWRGASQKMLATYNVECINWFTLFNLCDPLVVHTDAAWSNAVSFPEPVRPAPVTAQPVRVVAPAVAGAASSDVLERIVSVVPRWRGETVTRRNGTTQGLELLMFPRSKFCPLLDNEHSSAGSCYVIHTTTGALLFKCHKSKCAHSVLSIPGQPIGSQKERNILDRFNTSYVMLGGDVVYALPVVLDNGKLSEGRFLNHRTFVAETRRVGERIKDPDTEKPIEYPKYWLKCDRARRCPLGVLCDPSQSCDPRYLNTYQGIDSRVADAARQMSKLTDHELRAKCSAWFRCLRYNMCNDDPEVEVYVLNMAAHAMQLPHKKPGVAMVFVGNPGCGKGLVIRMLVNIYGKPHGVQINGSDFRSRFNSFFADTVIVLVDEMTDTNDLMGNNNLKGLITEESMTIHEKHVAERVRPQFQHFWIASNDNNVVRVQPGERRYCVLNCNYRLGEPTSPEHIELGAQLAAELDNPEALAALYTLLLRRDITDFVPRLMPTTQATWKVQYASMSPYERFVYRLLCTNNVCVRAWEPETDKLRYQTELLVSTAVEHGMPGVDLSELGYNVFERVRMRYPSDLLYGGFKQHFPNDRHSNSSQLWIYLHELHDGWDKRQVSTAAGRVTAFLFPPKEELKASFLRKRGGGIDERIFADWRIE